MYSKKYNLAAEFNGSYWHSDSFRSATYHLDKFIACENKGVSLIHIYEDELRDSKHKQILIDLLKQKTNTELLLNYSIQKIQTFETQNFLKQNDLFNSQALEDNNFGLFTQAGELIRVCGITDCGKGSFIINYDVPKCGQTYAKTSNLLVAFLKETLEAKMLKVSVDINKFDYNHYLEMGFNRDDSTSTITLSELYPRISCNFIIYPCPKFTLI